MAFFGRWIATVAIAFILFPIAFVVWKGPDADFGIVGGVILMLFLQFVSPYDLWLIPLGAGTALAIAWHFYVVRKGVPRASEAEPADHP